MVPEILTESFPHKESNYNLISSTALQGRSIKTVMYGSETISRTKNMRHFTDGIKKHFVSYII